MRDVKKRNNDFRNSQPLSKGLEKDKTSEGPVMRVIRGQKAFWQKRATKKKIAQPRKGRVFY
jgi:hypothetical protein